MLDLQRNLYNAGLEQRITAYRKTGKSPTKFEQYKEMSFKDAGEDWLKEYPSSFWRGPLDRLDKTYKAFFERIKKIKQNKASGIPPRTKSTKKSRKKKKNANRIGGFPRFKSKDRWRSITFSDLAGISFAEDYKTVQIKGIQNPLKVKLHREIPESGKVKSIVLTKVLGKWKITFQVKFPDLAKNDSYVNPIGLDLGITTLATLSSGDEIPNMRFHTNALECQRLEQRKLSRMKKGSRRRNRQKIKLGKLHRKIRNKRSTYLHTVSRSLVDQYDFIAIEDLQVENMKRGNLSRQISDAAWRMLSNQLKYKAESAGTILIGVDPRNTSQACSRCKELVPKKLSVRIHSCPSCGLELGRDHNAALNVLARGELDWTNIRSSAGP